MSLLVVLLGLFSFFGNTEKGSYEQVMSTINKYSKSIKKNEKIVLRGYGLHYAGEDKKYDGKIHVIDLSYSIDERLQYEEARKFFYSTVDGLLTELNSDPKIKTHFAHYPVGYEDLHFSVSFDYESKGILNRDDVDMISIFENKIYYFIMEKDGEVSKPKMDKVIPDVYFYNGDEMKTRSIVRKLPETEM
jgi:hypothetical protein